MVLAHMEQGPAIQLYKVQWVEQWIPPPPFNKEATEMCLDQWNVLKWDTSLYGKKIVKIGFVYALTWQEANGITGFYAKYFHMKAMQQIMLPTEDG